MQGVDLYRQLRPDLQKSFANHVFYMPIYGYVYLSPLICFLYILFRHQQHLSTASPQQGSGAGSSQTPADCSRVRLQTLKVVCDLSLKLRS